MQAAGHSAADAPGDVAVIPWLIAPAPEAIPRRHAKILALTGLALLVALIASTATWLIRGRCEALGRSSTTGSGLGCGLAVCTTATASSIDWPPGRS